MKDRLIKSILKRKVKSWAKSIDDPEVRKIVLENTIITGGSITSLILNEPVNDFDVYFRTKALGYEADGRIRIFVKSCGVVDESGKKSDAEVALEEIDNYTDDMPPDVIGEGEQQEITETLTELEEEEAAVKRDSKEETEEDKPVRARYTPAFFSTNAISLTDKIQIIVRFYGEVEKIHENYDFVHCTCSWQSWDGKLTIPPEAMRAMLNRELRYIGSKYPLCSLFRLRKFINRGWNITAGQILKIGFQVSELDLSNIYVLEDQLIGVDFTYFRTLINMLQRKGEKEGTGDAIDKAYLAELIDKIM